QEFARGIAGKLLGNLETLELGAASPGAVIRMDDRIRALDLARLNLSLLPGGQGFGQRFAGLVLLRIKALDARSAAPGKERKQAAQRDPAAQGRLNSACHGSSPVKLAM